MPEDKKENKLGALWLKTAKNGSKYMSGTIEVNGEKVSITVFKNKYKTEKKHPDYVITKHIENYKKQEALPKGENLDEEIPF